MHADVYAAYAPLVETASRRHGVDHKLLAAIVYRESGWKWWARGRAGEVGLAQILPSTAKEMCPREAQWLWFPSPSLSCAARILKAHFRRCGSWASAASAYNGARDCRVSAYGEEVLLAATRLR